MSETLMAVACHGLLLGILLLALWRARHKGWRRGLPWGLLLVGWALRAGFAALPARVDAGGALHEPFYLLGLSILFSAAGLGAWLWTILRRYLPPRNSRMRSSK